MKTTETDIVLIGAGIMSATLGVFLKELQPDLNIEIYETLDAVAEESSAAWNNAGTGHSALCELNYTPKRADGSVDISKALHITESFEVSRQFWSYLIETGAISSPDSFIHSIPHMSFVLGDYLLTVIKYPLDPGQVGNQYTLSVRNASNSDHSLIEFDWLTPGVNPYDFTQQLSGYSFSFTPAYQVTWAGAPLTGTGTFSNDTLNFSGIVHSSDGDSVIVLKGYK